MSVRQPRYSPEDHARRGTEIYERQVRPQVEAGHHGQVVAIDVDIGEFEVANDSLTASRQLLECIPDAQIWCVRVGYAAVHRFRLHYAVDLVSYPAVGGPPIRPGK